MAVKIRNIIIAISAVFCVLLISYAVYDVTHMDPVLWDLTSNESDYLEEDLKAGADANMMSDTDITQNGLHENVPLRIAVDYSDNECMQLLIDYGADVNYVDKANESLLMYTAGNCNFDKSKILIDNGADVTYRNPDGDDIMKYAVTVPYGGYNYNEESAVKIINLLIDEGLKIDSADCKKLLNSYNNPTISCMKTLSYVYDTYQNEEDMILRDNIVEHIFNGDNEKVMDYIRENLKYDKRDLAVIGLCVAEDNVDALEEYYNNSGSLEVGTGYFYNESLLMVAAAFDSVECAEFLLSNGADKNHKSEMYIDGIGAMKAIDYAKQYGSENIMKML